MENRQYLIILHGWQGLKERWDKIKEKIEKGGVKVIIPDLPGFIEGTELTQPWDLNNYLVWMENFIEKEKSSGNLIEPFFLLGHSFGGRIAIKFAVKHPQKLKGLILISAAGIKTKEKFISNFTPFLKKFSFLPGYSFFRKLFYKFVIRKTDYLNVEGVMKETFKKVIEEDLAPILPQIRTKTLIIWGEKDKDTPISDGYLMKEKIENARMEILKGIGHIPHLDCPEILAKKILDFIKP